MEENKQSCKALEETMMEISNKNKEEKICKEKILKDEKQTELSSNSSCDCTFENALTGGGGELQASQTGTVSSSVLLLESDLQADFSASSHLLSEVPIQYSLQPLHPVEDFKDQVRFVPEEPLIGITSQCAQVQAQNPRQVPDGPAKMEVSPTSITQPISSILSPTLPEQKLSQVENGSNQYIVEQDKQNHLEPKPLSSVPMLKTPSDGYNWRKYGQKQVKSPEGSRSYYRCTFTDCNAKKIECCNHSNHIIEIVYRSHHNHNPPQKVNCTMERPALSVVRANGSKDTALAGGGRSDVVSTSSKEPLLEKIQVPETKQQDSSGSDETMEVNDSEEHVDKPELKKRLKKNAADDSESFSKPGKKPKFVVHAAGDVGISGDGYRWRKYGQKMVKGNPHPRNYYKCTSAGCPVRKHIERAVDNTSAVIITYKGVHDHDVPVPKKRHGPTSSPLVVAASLASVHNLHINKTEPNQNRTTQWSVDKEGELTGETLNLGGDNTVKLAPALLSIGFEIKPC